MTINLAHLWGPADSTPSRLKTSPFRKHNLILLGILLENYIEILLEILHKITPETYHQSLHVPLQAIRSAERAMEMDRPVALQEAFNGHLDLVGVEETAVAAVAVAAEEEE